MRTNEVRRAFLERSHPLGVIVRQRRAILQTDEFAVKITIVGIAINFVGHVVTDGFHLLASHPFAKVCRDVVRIGRLHNIGERDLVLPLELTLQGENIMNKRVLETAGRLAELNALA